MGIRKSYNAGPVTVTKHFIDWDNLEDSVRQRLNAVQPGSTVYLNPEYTITMPEEAPVEQFVKQARRAQALWNGRLARTLGSANRKKAAKRADPATRQLTFTGVMLVKGQPIHPKGWPDVQESPGTETCVM